MEDKKYIDYLNDDNLKYYQVDRVLTKKAKYLTKEKNRKHYAELTFEQFCSQVESGNIISPIFEKWDQFDEEMKIEEYKEAHEIFLEAFQFTKDSAIFNEVKFESILSNFKNSELAELQKFLETRATDFSLEAVKEPSEFIKLGYYLVREVETLKMEESNVSLDLEKMVLNKISERSDERNC